MSYSTHWDLLDKNKEVVQEFTRICFSNHLDRPFYEADEETEKDTDAWGDPNIIRNGNSKLPPHYFRYKFHNAKVTDAEMNKYFHFVKATPEFKHLMPKSIKQMVKDKAYTADLTQINGTQLFAILTVLRAVVEEPGIVSNVAKFNHRIKHAVPHLGIIKAAGSRFSCNYNHWITNQIHKDSMHKSINPLYQDMWDSPTPALETGLVSGIHSVFQYGTDGYLCDSPVRRDWDLELLKAQQVKMGKRLLKIEKEAKPRKAPAPVYTTGTMAW